MNRKTSEVPMLPKSGTDEESSRSKPTALDSHLKCGHC